jgi:hypothetical protein
MFTWRQNLGDPTCPYLTRWVVKFWLFSIRLHHWHASDDPRAMHDHPWWYVTLVLRGGYVDHAHNGDDALAAGSVRFRPAKHRHTVVVNPGGCWTIMLTGRDKHDWGFWWGSKFFRRNKWFFANGHHPCK